MMAILALLVPAVALGVNVGVKADVNTMVDVQNVKSVKATTTVGASVNANANATSETRGNATSSEAKNNGNANVNASTTANTQGKLMSEEHRSVVATFVKSLISASDRVGGIGAEVRVVAMAQNDSASTTANSIAKIENRGSFKTFLIGSDYESIGMIRSAMASTDANIDKLNNLLANTTNLSARAEIAGQIQVLRDEEVKLEAYLEANESKFSLFGWFRKLFVK